MKGFFPNFEPNDALLSFRNPHRNLRPKHHLGPRIGDLHGHDHFAQKSVAVNAHSVVSLLVFYGVAGVLTLPLLLWFPLTQPITKEIAQTNWAVLLVAASIVLIELGFLLAYRAGGSLSNSFVLTAAVVTVSQALIGTLLFKETLSAQKRIGAALCLAGVSFISRK
jgi:drug/metabolite transporter (DMT)-like permease